MSCWEVATDSNDKTVLWAAFGDGPCYALRPDGELDSRLSQPAGLNLEPVDPDEPYEVNEDAARTWAQDRLADVKFAKSTRDKITAALESE